ncbi:MAG TPA: hypothetical protein VH143_29530 [Kofleriaceae bacterium]|nr:hypothetical protein [Kofleriaceae bacterium]
MRLLSAFALTIAAACALAFSSCELGDGAPTPPGGVDGGGVGPHNPSSDAPFAESDAGSFPDANFFPDSGTIGPTMDAL